MKNIILSLAVIIAVLTACNSNTAVKENDNHQMGDSGIMDSAMNNQEGDGMEKQQTGISKNINVEQILSAYLEVKNALAKDDAKAAASAGNEVASAIQKVDAGSLNAEQKKMYEDVKEDIKEHGEHIGMNADKIAHQREHFETMSKDMYDLVKVFGTNQILYYTHCPMYNNNKGANWLSEVKEISNPYLGKKMPDCGTIKEEIK